MKLTRSHCIPRVSKGNLELMTYNRSVECQFSRWRLMHECCISLSLNKGVSQDYVSENVVML
jgi:hypothetical protein